MDIMREDKYMKKIITTALIIILGVMIIIYLFVGAILQQSYKQCPPSEEELEELHNGIDIYWYLLD